MVFKSNVLTIVILIIIFLTILILIWYLIAKSVNFRQSTIKWGPYNCNFDINDTLSKILKDKKINFDANDWNLYIPCSYDDSQKDIELQDIKKDATYFILNNSDVMVAKESLWENVVEKYGNEYATKMLPQTFVLTNDNSIIDFKQKYEDDKLYIMKKNIQRQEGLKITKDLNEILDGSKSGYVIVQELLQNPYTINGKKINMRIYILIVCKENKMNVYMYLNGFMYYTKDDFLENSSEEGPNITTGYIDRKIYETNPLTLEDLKLYLDNSNRSLSDYEINKINEGKILSKIFFDNIIKLLQNVFLAFKGKVGGGKLYSNTSFQLFGVDVSMDSTYHPLVMEINKGPDMSAKDERDKMLKENVIRNMFDIVYPTENKLSDNNLFNNIISIQ